jgi:D-alanyl-D-alanine carboxypeptidase
MIVEAKGTGGQGVVSIVLGSNDRDADTLSVVDYTFRSFEWQSALK